MYRSIVLMLLLLATIAGGCHDRDKFAAGPISSVVTFPESPIPNRTYRQPSLGKSGSFVYGIPPRVKSDPWANEQFRRMNQLYEQFRYDECLEAAESLIEYPNVGDLRRASIFVTQGAVLFLKGRYGEARRAFSNAHRLDPDFRINSRYFNPELVRCFESSR